MPFEQLGKEKSQESLARAHESRERLKREFNLEAEPEKYKILEERGKEIYHQKTEELEKSANPEEVGRVLDTALSEIASLFPNDGYGTRAREAAFRRIREKARDEISDWLKAQEKLELVAAISAASETWQSAQDAGRWISEKILSTYPNPHELFEMAKNTKLEEFQNFYKQKAAQ